MSNNIGVIEQFPGAREMLVDQSLDRMRRRYFIDMLMRGVLITSLLLTFVPLVAVLWFTLQKGLGAINIQFLTTSMFSVGPLDESGGVLHSIVGTLQQVAIASAIAIPLGIAIAIYLNEYGRSAFSVFLRFFVDVMTGIPSIVAGLFVFSFWVLSLHQGFSGFSAGLALAVLMLPTVARSSEEMLRLVPSELREASFALGVSQWRTVLFVVLPTALSGITTGIVLAIARVTGETAPLLMTAFGYDAMKYDVFNGPQSSLPLFVFSQAGSSFDVAIERAWGGALTLIVIVLLLTFIARVLSGRTQRNAR